MIEFLKYQSTPNEKHIGLVCIRYLGKILLWFKIVPTKDGKFFVASHSFKVNQDGEEHYINCFTIDSYSEKEAIDSFIRAELKKQAQGAQFDDIPF